MLGGSIHRAAEEGPHAWALAAVRCAWECHASGPCPYDAADIARLAAVLRQVGEEWASVRLGHGLELAWPLGTIRHRGGRTRGRRDGRAGAAAGRRTAHAGRRG